MLRRLPEDFAFLVHHECTYGCKGAFVPSRYNSSRAKCIKCSICGLFFSPNKFIFHSHQTGSSDKYVQPDAANFNSWRRHMKLSGEPPDEIVHAWEDVKAMFNGGTRKRIIASASHSSSLNVMKKHIKFSNNASMPSLSAHNAIAESSIESVPNQQRVPPFTDTALPICNTNVIDYMWQHQQQVAVATAII
ncbi:hypothetical protein TSAR_004868 [Trichomalopsis sarcophagae]|uniref:c-SKI SMAD4-binding domain-containing protein n=1 Tax=Trichomalopsis sarcophagae TaxID=543379 RepID=A0A232F0J8_9HYME|nr:hypothetical protein TSAR_004868 [Trichomalopsis sarcophagae]